MAYWDWLTNLVGDPGTTDPTQLDEMRRIRGLGQTPPDVTYEGPQTPIDPQERDILFPKGLPDQAHQGGLAQLAASSMAQQSQQQAQNAQPQAPSPSTPPPGQQKGIRYLTNAPEAAGQLDKEQRKSRMWGDMGYSIGSVIRLAASMGAGGAAGSAGGTGQGMVESPSGATSAINLSGGTGMPAAGGATGASSMQGGGGLMGKLGSAYGKYQQGDYMGAIGDAYGAAKDSGILNSSGGGAGGAAAGGGGGYLQPGESPHGQAGGKMMGGAINEILYDFTGDKKRRALAQLGMIPGLTPQMSTGDVWYTG